MSSFDLHPILDAGQAPRPGIWYAISPEDNTEAPCPRVGACASFLSGENGGKVVLTCGATPEGPFSDVRQLTLRTGSFSWSKVASTGLRPRYEHTMFAVGNNLYIFAGAQETGPMNDLWQYDPDLGCWGEASPRGVPPSPRTLHCTTSTRGTSHLVFSGGTAGTTPTDDQNIYCLETDPLEWSRPATSGTAPPPRQGHVLAVVGNRLFVHGGMAGQEILDDLHMLELDTWSWSRPVVSGAPPPPLAAHGCAVVGRKLYIFGGLTIGGASDDLYSLNTDTMLWEKVPILGLPPPARLDHAMCSILIPAGDEQKFSTTSAKPSSSTQSGASKIHKEDGAAVLVPIISPENLQTQDVGIHPSAIVSEKPGDTEPSASCAGEKNDFFPALFVFGGMDTCGTVHGDCFVFVPHLSARS